MRSDCSPERWLATAAEGMPCPGSVAARKAFARAVLVVFLLTQATDGVLTYIGVGMHGMHAEANPLAARLMAAVGLGPAVAGLKLATASIGCGLHVLGVHRVLAVVAAIYVVAAVLPWAAVLLAW
jgi:hypothetical protein